MADLGLTGVELVNLRQLATRPLRDERMLCTLDIAGLVHGNALSHRGRAAVADVRDGVEAYDALIRMAD